MSPEQKTSSGYLRPASDLYFLVCVLSEMLAAKIGNEAGVEGTEPSHWRTDVPSWPDEELDKMLATEWQQRYRRTLDARSSLKKGSSPELRRRQRFDMLFERADASVAAKKWGKAIAACEEGLQLRRGNSRFRQLLAQAKQEQARETRRQQCDVPVRLGHSPVRGGAGCSLSCPDSLRSTLTRPTAARSARLAHQV